MGRWKRRKSRYVSQSKKKKTSDIDNPDDCKIECNSFTHIELELLKSYLREYRDKSFQFRNTNINYPVHSSDQFEASGHIFPKLSHRILSRPYLALPPTLSTKQRRSVHCLALDLDLFHLSHSPSPDSRQVILSIYRDGFQDLESHDLGNPLPPTIPFRRCKPWFCNTRNNVDSCTNIVRKQIEALIDQPSRCLRDEHDVLDYKALDGQSLSTVPKIRSFQPSGSSDDGCWMLVDSDVKMKQCARELLQGSPTELAFDVEFYNPSKYVQVTSLIQLSSNLGRDYVIDPFADGVWDQVSLLRPLFLNPQIVKIGHCIGGDVQSLHRDFGIFVVNAFDTYEAAKVLNLTQKGLVSVCKHFGLTDCDEYYQLKETYQSFDWRRRPLTEPMVRYGRYDVYFLVRIRQLFMRDMTKDDLWGKKHPKEEMQRVAQSLADTLQSISVAEGDVDEFDIARAATDDNIPESNLSDDSSNDDAFYTPESEGSVSTERKAKVGAKELRMQPTLMQAISASQQQCLSLWTERNEKLSKCARYCEVIKQAQCGELEWSSFQAQLLEEMMTWRRTVATKECCLEGMVCSLDLLVSIAAKRPCSEATLRRIQYQLPELLEEEEYREEMLALVRSSVCREGLTSEDDVPSYRTRRRRTLEVPQSVVDWGPCLAVASILVVAIVVVRRLKR